MSYDRDNSYGNRQQEYGGGRQQEYGGGEQQEYGGGRQQEYGGDRQQEYGGGRQQEYGGGEQQSYGQQGRGEYNDTRYQGSQDQHEDFSSAASHAQEHHSGADRGLFDNALSFLQQNKSNISNGDIDQEQAVNAHQAVYGNQGSGQQESHSSDTLGAGAAMQALKLFTSGSGSSSDGGFDKNKLIGLAMSQASSLWDQKSGEGANLSGDKQSAVNSAAQMALKMYLSSGNSGGLTGTGGLMSLASKFL
ncbi:hypothetical protein N7495_004743 [Penicillium taxi]|uniref:uncharacterized protein n=1 Tax=Penicillium taxi TaxID=168475 RepID=UPI00254539B8|nr:uncharacterized protein N7495_004743 [Penicillium taxi]KAJ5899999.1 hypothetical protein N7495_004743 [Penicillium taxi]